MLVLVLFGISTLAGNLLFGEAGLWVALAVSLFALIVEPVATSVLTLRMYRARPIHPAEAPDLWALIYELARRAKLESIPKLHYIPSTMINAFATGSRRHSAIALTDGLLHTLTPRELVGVIAHEIAHIANGDLRVMSLADYVSRLTSLMALVAKISILLSLPWLLSGQLNINWWGLLLLVISPQLALLAQLGLSRVRELDADHTAAELTGDPRGLASALARLEQINRSWLAWLLPGWGNPEPSWLRTHPPTGERITRLLALETSAHTPIPNTGSQFSPTSKPIRRPPRWHPGGFWR
ncbi:zinc metalloprotease HtpX [Nitrosomonas sp. ANs5]|uniref:zinc metalloprotease HtpX n=1 Tax=Nitrosomonas sp. ANs5 TaxID=3423941 RepID=UPI003D32713B